MDEAYIRGKIANNPELLLPGRPIAFNRDLATIGGGACCGLFLSQAVYWARKQSVIDKGGWFYKTAPEWERETALTYEEQKTVRRKLRERGILEEKKVGLPARNFYRVNLDKIALLIAESRLKQEEGKSTVQCGEKPRTGEGETPAPSITEITAETTSETTIEKKTKKFVEAVKGAIEGMPLNKAQVELIRDFVAYWTEPNKSQTKLRWEMQPTWDTKRRIATWFRRSQQYQSKGQVNIKKGGIYEI